MGLGNWQHPSKGALVVRVSVLKVLQFSAGDEQDSLHCGVLQAEQRKQAQTSTAQVEISPNLPVFKSINHPLPLVSEHRHFSNFIFYHLNFCKE